MRTLWIIAAAGLALPLIAGLVILAAQLHLWRDWRKHLPKAMMVVLVILWGSETPRRLNQLHDQVTLWAYTVQQVPTKPRPRINYGDALNKAGDPVAAIQQLALAKQYLVDAPLAPDRKRSWAFLVNVELGRFAQAVGQSEIATAYFRDAAVSEPKFVRWITPDQNVSAAR